MIISYFLIFWTLRYSVLCGRQILNQKFVYLHALVNMSHAASFNDSYSHSSSISGSSNFKNFLILTIFCDKENYFSLLNWCVFFYLSAINYGLIIYNSVVHVFDQSQLEIRALRRRHNERVSSGPCRSALPGQDPFCQRHSGGGQVARANRADDAARPHPQTTS